MKHVLFVDDDPFILSGLSRMFRRMNVPWEIRCAVNGMEALTLLDESPADVVVSDMDMPRMNGVQLLNEVRKRYPKTIRMVLSGSVDQEQIIECMKVSHQYLSKPCDGFLLFTTIDRALKLDEWIDDEAIKTFLSQVQTIPSPPELYRRIVKELENDKSDIEAIGYLISRDVAMTTRILQLVNSAFFGIATKVSNPKDAIIYLGMDMVKALVLAIHLFSERKFDESVKVSMAMLHRHSLNTAIIAKNIVLLECKKAELANTAFSAGLLHDIGRLVLLANFPDQYREVIALAKRDHLTITDAEKAVFGFSHSEVGAYLLGLWGLPMPLVEAAMFHHHPSLCQDQQFTSLTAVHVANVFDRTEALIKSETVSDEPDTEYLKHVGMADRLPYWREKLLGSAINLS